MNKVVIVNELTLSVFLMLFICLTSCKWDKYQQDKGKKSLLKEFVKLKYKGEFRTDSVFINKLHNQIEVALKNDNNKVVKKNLELEIEWFLLKENTVIPYEKLKRLKYYNSFKLDEDYYWLLAYYHANKNDYTLAIAAINNYLIKSKDSVIKLKSNWLLGSIYEEMKVDSLALKFYQAAEELGAIENIKDYYIESIFHIGNMMYLNKKILSSEEKYNKALKESQKYNVTRLVPFGYYHLGKIQEQKGNYKKAVNEYKKALDFIILELKQPKHFFLPLLNKKIAKLK